MKNLKKAEIAVILITLLCLVFTAGFFIGRSTAYSPVTIDKLSSVSGADASAGTPASEDNPGTGVTPVSETAESPGIITKININTATLADLVSLPGIGEVTAQKIIDYRVKIDGFKSIEQIQDVKGIGEKKYGSIKDLITVG